MFTCSKQCLQSGYLPTFVTTYYGSFKISGKLVNIKTVTQIYAFVFHDCTDWTVQYLLNINYHVTSSILRKTLLKLNLSITQIFYLFVSHSLKAKLSVNKQLNLCNTETPLTLTKILNKSCLNRYNATSHEAFTDLKRVEFKCLLAVSIMPRFQITRIIPLTTIFEDNFGPTCLLVLFIGRFGEMGSPF